MAAVCLCRFWVKRALAEQEAASGGGPTGGAEKLPQAKTAREAARQGVTRGLLVGELAKLLANVSPASLNEVVQDQDDPTGTGPGSAVAAFALRLARVLEANANLRVPGVLCEVAEGNVCSELLGRGSGAGFDAASAGLGTEAMRGIVCELAPKEVAFGRLFVTLDWQSVTRADGNSFEVPVLQTGSSPAHPLPIYYVATSEEDQFIVIIPWQDLTEPPPSEKIAYAACTEILKSTQPMETEMASHTVLRLPTFELRRVARTIQIVPPGGNADGAALLGMPANPALHVTEFSSTSIHAGRTMPGRLPRTADPAATPAFVVRRPFCLCVWHTGIEELNAPLSVTLVA